MNGGGFEWDEQKAVGNYARHVVSFAAARDAFKDPFAIEQLDDREDYGEDWFNIVGMVEGRLLSVRPFALFRREEPNHMSNGDTTKTTAKSPGHNWERFDLMSGARRHAAALSDPDARPLSPDDFKRMKRTPQVKIIRRALGLSQEEFSARFHIPLGTLRDWEQGRKAPDAAARAYLAVIGRNPQAVREALSLGRDRQ
jgi:putative transcriptional regulator